MKTAVFGLGRRGARWLRLLGIGSGMWLLLLLEPPGALWTKGAIAQAQHDDSVYEQEIGKGREFLRRRQYEEALKSFKRANEIAGKKSPECLLWMAEAYQGLDAYKNVVETCDKAIELAGSDVGILGQAYNRKGVALQLSAENKDQKKLKEAEAAFRQGLALNAGLHILHYNLGFMLMQQGRDPEGVAELKNYLEAEPKGTSAAEARRLIENPRRARESYAPEFSVTTSAGEYLALEDLRGKVVLLDFWGTWCPPCVASVPSLRNLYRRFEKEPAFLMIGISSDSEAEKWRAFTAANKMVWPQYLDRDRRVQRAFEVRAFPTYILIDHEGIVRFRSTGFGSTGTATIEEAIRKALKMVSKTAASD